ncbi:MAG: hypothetical protein Q8P18_09610 [Pseudomonadota bacterium]|nr:hypothetical protein [Pseudomonadota bacterium]
MSAEALHDRYRKAFVGRSRATRDLVLLDSLIGDTERLLASGVEDGQKAAVDERLALYRSERIEIAAVQAGGPAALAGWRLAEWSEVNRARYMRHFAGKARPTRDLGLMSELAAEEAAWIAAMPKIDNSRLASRKEQMEVNERLYGTERAAIADARAALSPAEQARVLATAANTQFGHYRLHFQGQPLNSRRPALLQRVIDALEAIRVSMVRVREQGIDTEVHAANLAKVTERITHHRGELTRIKKARSEARGTSIAAALGDDANKRFESYRQSYAGKPRDTRDRAALSDHCDVLHELARTMQLLDSERPDETTKKNIGIVLDHLKMAEREYVAISEAQKAKAN